MAAENHLINYDSAVKGLNATFKTHVSQLSEVVSKYVDLNGQLSKLPSEYISNLNQMHQAQEKVKTSTENVVNSTKKLNTAVQQRLTTGASLYKQQQKEIIATERQTKAEEKLSNTYNKVQAKINSMSQTYNNIATRKQLGLKLTIQEEAQLLSLERRLLKYNDVLKAVDAQVGKHQRNVGNYKSGFDGLGNSINQITREMPAFAVSAQVGFLALSNNIPILADEIQRLSRNVAEMRAQGKQVPGVMSQILSSFLGWQTLLSIGVTLVTIYGKEIGEFFAEMFRGTKTIDRAKIALESFNEALKGGEYEEAYTKVSKVNIAFKQAREGVISKEQALKVYNKELGETMGVTKDFAVAENTFIKQARNYVDATLAKAQANILLQKSAELAAQNTELQRGKEVSWGEQLKAWFQSGGPFSKLFDPENNKVLDNRSKLINENAEEIKANAAEAENLIAKFYELSEALNFDGKQPKEKKEKDNTKELLDQQYRLQVARINQMEDGTAKELELLQAWHEYQKQLHKKDSVELLIIEIDYWTKLHDINKRAYDKENEEFIKANDEKEKEYERWQSEYLKGIEEFEKAKQWWRDWEEDKILKSEAEKDKIYQETVDNLKDILAHSFDGLGFGSLSFLFDEQLKKMWENTETATGRMAIAFEVFGSIVSDVFRQIKASSDAYYENQFNLLEKEKETAIKYAGENTEGREAIEEQYNQRRLQLKRQQARQEKNMAIFQALINVATGVTSALAQAPPYSFILAALVGALGAAQIATISSQPLPQFYKGTQNAPEGWAIVDELRPEVHTDKHGNLKSTGSDKGANLRYLEKGDKIFKSHSDFFREMSPSYVDRNGNIHIENNGISKSDMRDVLKETLGSQTKEQTVIDEHGFNHFVINGQNKVRKRNKRTKH